MNMDELIDDIDLVEDISIDATYTPPEEGNTEDLHDPYPEVDSENSDATVTVEDSDKLLVSQILKSLGIEDSSRIKFENESGEVEEVDWNSLNVEDKLNIINSSNVDPSEQLDESEIELINSIRESNLTPAEYIQYLLRESVGMYIQNLQALEHMYSVDQYSDEELFVMDLISKSEEITEEEAIEALDRAKSNESLFKKLLGAIRAEYKRLEEESLLYMKTKQELESQDQFNQFAELVYESISNFGSLHGGMIEMNDEDKLDLYNFITGVDKAGNSWIGKALLDTDTLVEMAWYVLYGEKMLQDITNYYEKEIANVRNESYKKGLAEADKKDKPTVAYKPKDKNTKVTLAYDDLDDF